MEWTINLGNVVDRVAVWLIHACRHSVRRRCVVKENGEGTDQAREEKTQNVKRTLTPPGHRRPIADGQLLEAATS